MFMKFRISVALEEREGLPFEAFKLYAIFENGDLRFFEPQEFIGTFIDEAAAREAALIYRKAKEAKDIEFDIL